MDLTLFPKRALALVLAAAFAAIVSVSGRDAFAANAAVTIDNFAFSPASVTVNVGDTLTFTNAQSGIPHTASADTAGGFDSGALGSGQSFTTGPFSTAGTFTYHCNIHPGMQGTVIVAGAQAAPPTAVPAAATAPPPTSAPAPVTQAAATPTTAPTSLATATSASIAVSPTAGSATAPSGSPTATPAAPSTGEDDGDGGGNSTAVVMLAIAAIVAVGGVGAWAVMRRRNAA